MVRARYGAATRFKIRFKFVARCARHGLLGSRPNFVQVQKYREALREEHGLDYAEACAFIPTGWAAVSTYNVKNSRQTKGGA